LILMTNIRKVLFLFSILPVSLAACGKNVISGRNVENQTTILDDGSDVLDATAFAVASKAELDAVVVNSTALADMSLGRMFDFDNANLELGLAPLSRRALSNPKPVFCDGEAAINDVARLDGVNIKLTYEADVTACATKPQSLAFRGDSVAAAADQLIVDRQLAAFSLTFSCDSRDLTELVRSSEGKASMVMSTAAAFSCPAKGKDKAATGRAYRFAGRVDGRYVGPRSEVPVQQRFWRGYDAGTPGDPCMLTRQGSSHEGPSHARLGSCQLFERSESVNLVDNSRKGRLLTASASARTRNSSLFNDGDLAIKVNGWASSHGFSSQDSDITIDFMRPSGECARYTLRPAAVNFEARDCR